jgi:hypothetical protein
VDTACPFRMSRMACSSISDRRSPATRYLDALDFRPLFKQRMPSMQRMPPNPRNPVALSALLEAYPLARISYKYERACAKAAAAYY